MSNKINLKAIIVDDSVQARRLLRLMLKDLAPQVDIVGEAETADDGHQLIRSINPNVIFLDIEMPGKTGLQLAEMLTNNKFEGKIIFTTAYDTYAIKAFRLSALDYLLKPIQEEELTEAINKLSKELEKSNEFSKLEALKRNLLNEENNVLCVPTQGGYEYVPLMDIYCIEADGSYVRIICKTQKDKFVAKNLKYFEKALEHSSMFARPHRSYLINIDEVVSYSKSERGILLLSNGMKIPVSRERKQIIQEFFG